MSVTASSPPAARRTRMDQDKLRALRDKYGPAPEGTIFDPDFAEVGKQIFRAGRRLWPFAGVSTFLDAPFRPNKPGDEPDLAGLDYALIGVQLGRATSDLTSIMRNSYAVF